MQVVRGGARFHSGSKTGFSPSMTPYSKGFISRPHADVASLDYNSTHYQKSVDVVVGTCEADN